MIFFDTSVLAAASLTAHHDYARSAARIGGISKDSAACSTHSFGELYTTLTRLPRPQRLAPGDAAAVVRKLASHLKPIALTAEEYLQTLDTAAAHGLSGTIIYDALLLACAKKSGAKRIYTLNVRHFKLVAADLAQRIYEP